MTVRETSVEIDEAAAQWAMRIDEAVLNDTEQTEFDTWLQGDIRRVGAFARAQAVLLHVKRAKALGPDFAPEDFVPEAQESKAPVPEGVADEPAAPIRLTRRRMLIGGSAVAASGVVALVLPTTRAAALVYETGRGEIRLVPLADGSSVTLNTNSRIAVTIDSTHRDVRLLQGEALFKVASARRGRFTVDAGSASLHADAATFSVCRIDKAPLEVNVCEGAIEVTRNDFLARGSHRLHANMQATIPGRGEIVDRGVSAQLLQRQLAWQEGMLSFEDTPLRQAADEFARYSDRRISIPDADVGAETVTGLYAANNPEGFAQAVALSLNLHMQSTSGGILLSR